MTLGSVTMRHEQKVPGRRVGARQKVRRMLDLGLEWVRGYPTELACPHESSAALPTPGVAAGLAFTTWPRAGVELRAKKYRITSSELRKAVFLRNKIQREFPRALPSVVGDAALWTARVDATLDAVKAQLKDPVSDGRDLPDLEDLMAARVLRDRVERDVKRLARSRPELEPLLMAILWSQTYSTDLDRTVAVVLAYRDALADLIAGDQFELCVHLAELGRVEGARAIRPLVEFLNHPLCRTRLALARGPVANQADSVRRGTRRLEQDPGTQLEGVSTLFQSPNAKTSGSGEEFEASAFDALRRWLPHLLCLSQTRRAAVLPLVADLLPFDVLVAWAEHHQRVETVVLNARRLVNRWPGPRSGKAWRRLINGCEKKLVSLVVDQPAAVPFAATLGAIDELLLKSGAGVDAHIKIVRRALRNLPYRVAGVAVRVGLLLHWREVGRSYLETSLRKALPDLCRHLAKITEPEVELLPWLPTLASANAGISGLWSSPEGLILCDFEGLGVSRCLQATKRLCEGETAQLRKNVDEHLNCLLELVEGGTVDQAIEGYRAIVAAARPEPMLRLCGGILRSALRMTQGGSLRIRPQQFTDLVEQMMSREAFAALAHVLADCCLSPSVAGILGDAILLGETAFVVRILRAAQRGPEPSRSRILLPRRRPTNLDWSAYPSALHGVLVELEEVVDNPTEQATSTLAEALPVREKLDEEIAAIGLRLDRATPVRRAGMIKRLEQLELRRETVPQIAKSRLAKLEHRLHRRVVLARLQQLQVALDRAARTRIHSVLGPSAALLLTDSTAYLLDGIAQLGRHSRRLAVEVLQRRCGPRPWDLRDAKANQLYLSRLQGKGIDIEPWLRSQSQSIPSSGRILSLSFADDPIDVLRMGEPFGTCLSPGESNFFSAVTNAVDINKRVLFLRDEKGKVLGRCLFALTTEGELLTFCRYAHDHGLGFNDLVDSYARDLCRAMKTRIASRGAVPTLVANQWYDDGSVDLVEVFEFLSEDSDYRTSLADLTAEEFLADLLLRREAGELDGRALRLVIDLPELHEDHVIALTGFCTAQGSPDDMVALLRRMTEMDSIAAAQHLAKLVLRRPRALRSLVLPDVFHLVRVLVDFEPALALTVLRRRMSTWVRRAADETDPDWLFFAGEANLRLGRWKRARDLYERSLSSDRPGAYREACRERFKIL